MADNQPSAKRQKTYHATDIADTTDGAAAPSQPTSKVFAVVELLEKILSNLPLADLTRMERMNTVWREIIRTAPGLQEQRFLKATQATSWLIYVPGTVETDREDPQKTPLKESMDVHPRLTDDPSKANRPRVFGHLFSAIDICIVNPCILTLAHHIPDCPYITPGSGTPGLGCSIMDIWLTLRPQKMFDWSSGPWEEMYLTQPPCTFEEFDIDIEGSGMGFECTSMTNIGPITLGGLRDWMRTLINEEIKGYGDWAATLRVEGALLETDEVVQEAKKFQASRPKVADTLPRSERQLGVDDD